MVVGVATGQTWLVVGAGVLLVGGIIAAAVLASKIADLAADITQTEAQIRDVNTAITEMSEIVAAFSDLDQLYGTLNMFWGRMQNDTSAVKTMDDATAFIIGEEILYDTSSMDASLSMTQNMTSACQTYLDVLNKQGIKIPTTPPNDMIALTANFAPAALEGFESTEKSNPRDPAIDRCIVQARNALTQGNVLAYHGNMHMASLHQLAGVFNSGLQETASGPWFDTSALRSSATVWGTPSQNYSKFTQAGVIALRSANHADVIMEHTNAIDGSLDSVRGYVVGMLTSVIDMGKTIQEWSDEFPSMPSTAVQTQAVSRLQRRAVEMCEEAQHNAALANNTFADFTNHAREYQQDIEGELQAKGDAVNSRNAAADAQLHGLSPPWYVMLGGPAAIAIWIAVETKQIKDSLQAAVSNLENSMNDLKQLMSSGTTFGGQVQTWIGMTQIVSGHLGSVYDILSGVWGQLLENTTIYEQLMKTEWSQITEDAQDVLKILNVGQVLKSPVLNARFAMLAASPPVKNLLIQAVLPSVNLGSRIRSQAHDAHECFLHLDHLLQMPYTKDIIGYWDASNTTRHTLFEVSTSLRTEYIQMIATEYDTIQNLYNLSILQDYRARNVMDGRLSLPLFVQGTLQSIRAALKAANNTSTKFGNAAAQFEYVLSVIDNNIKEIESKISGLDKDIEKAEAGLRDKIIAIIADTIALAFSTAAVLLAFGFIGPVGATVALAVKIGASAAVTASTIKLVLDTLSLTDLIQTIQALKSLRGTLSQSIDGLKAVQPIFKNVVAGVKELTSTIEQMHVSLQKVADNLDISQQIVLTYEDAETIQHGWMMVREDAQTWMDVINEQGISPVSFSAANVRSFKSAGPPSAVPKPVASDVGEGVADKVAEETTEEVSPVVAPPEVATPC